MLGEKSTVKMVWLGLGANERGGTSGVPPWQRDMLPPRGTVLSLVLTVPPAFCVLSPLDSVIWATAHYREAPRPITRKAKQ